jgi:23S rRNA pseudouridine1911/1915/1917 synthase
MGKPPIELRVDERERGLRLENFVRLKLPGLSRGSVRRLLDRGQILINGRLEQKGYRVRDGEQVLVAAASTDEVPVPQSKLPLSLLAIHENYLVLNKPTGQHCHPLVPGETDTLANALVARYPECASASPNPREAGLVHRLDWSTSGVILAARNLPAYGKLRGLFSARQVRKDYYALVCGELVGTGVVTVPLETVPGDSSRIRAVAELDPDRDGRAAETQYRALEYREPFTWVGVTCHTGLRHQVRVHLAHIGHALLGDQTYGGWTWPGVEGALLHAQMLELEEQQFLAPLPDARKKLLRQLGFDPDAAFR